jgi:hypothetical protein
MTSFTDEILISKLTHLNGTSQSIQSMSMLGVLMSFGVCWWSRRFHGCDLMI